MSPIWQQKTFQQSEDYTSDLHQNYTKTLHTYMPKSMTMQSINFLHLTVSKIWPILDFKGQGRYSEVNSQIKISLRDIVRQDFKSQGQIKATSWHCRPTPPNNFHTRYQLSTPFDF